MAALSHQLGSVLPPANLYFLVARNISPMANQEALHYPLIAKIATTDIATGSNKTGAAQVIDH